MASNWPPPNGPQAPASSPAASEASGSIVDAPVVEAFRYIMPSSTSTINSVSVPSTLAQWEAALAASVNDPINIASGPAAAASAAPAAASAAPEVEWLEVPSLAAPAHHAPCTNAPASSQDMGEFTALALRCGFPPDVQQLVDPSRKMPPTTLVAKWKESFAHCDLQTTKDPHIPRTHNHQLYPLCNFVAASGKRHQGFYTPMLNIHYSCVLFLMRVHKHIMQNQSSSRICGNSSKGLQMG